MNALAASTFAGGGPGSMLVQFLLVGIVGYLITLILDALNQKNISSMAKVLTVFICISMVAKELYGLIGTIAGITGIK